MQISSFTLLTVLLLVVGMRAYGQHPYFYTINDESGLPSNEVYTLCQDEFGYMWLGCNAGLYKYDGFTFSQYKNSKQNAVAMSGLKVAGNGKVYCQNFYGQLFCADGDSLMLYADVKEKINMHPEYVVDSLGKMLIGMPNGILCVAPGGDTKLILSELNIAEIAFAADGALLAVDYHKGLIRVFKDSGGIYKYRKLYTQSNILDNSRVSIKVYEGKTLALCYSNPTDIHYICAIENDTLRILKTIEKNSLATFVYNITLCEGKIWLATSNGAYKMDASGNITAHLFAGEKISDIYKDKENAIWFTTLQNGIYVVPTEDLLLLNTENSNIKDNSITAIKKYSAGSILAGTYNGDIFQFQPETGAVQILPKNKVGVYRNVTSIIPYDANTIITGRGGISIIHTDRNTEVQWSSVYVRDMTLKGDSIVYVSTNGISYIEDVKTKLRQSTATIPEIFYTGPGKKICYDTGEQRLWVSLNEGLASVEGGIPKLYNIANAPVFSSALYCDKNGLWVGTISDGVYNIKNGTVAQHINQNNGLIGNNIRCITSVEDTVYIATDECIYVRYPDKSHKYINYADGINTKEVSSIEICNPYILVGTVRGLFYMPVASIGANATVPRIKLNSVYCDDIDRSGELAIQLKANNRNISISFSSVLLRSRGRFHYLYRVKGITDKWTKQAGAINTVRLGHLPAGSFVFQVKSVNEDGIESTNTAEVHIEVAAPLWQHWWFYTLIALVAASTVALVFVLRIKRLKRRADILNKITNSQLTALKAQMNPHFMYNTLNSIQDLVLQKDIKSTNYYLSRYSSLMRKILDTSEHREIELSEEIEILSLYLELEQLRFGSEFRYSIEVSDTIDLHRTFLPSMIIQPFVENAIKHGLLHKRGDKLVCVRFTQNDNQLLCTITDNGIGRERSAAIRQRSQLQHKSFATKATEKRLSLINLGRKEKITLSIEDLYENGQASGTEVQLKIPIDRHQS